VVCRCRFRGGDPEPGGIDARGYNPVESRAKGAILSMSPCNRCAACSLSFVMISGNKKMELTFGIVDDD
jgi:hypothetical protein